MKPFKTDIDKLNEMELKNRQHLTELENLKKSFNSADGEYYTELYERLEKLSYDIIKTTQWIREYSNSHGNM